MGRPLNNKFFGVPANPGASIVFTSAWLPGESAAVTNAYVIKQVGTSSFLAEDPTSGVQGVVSLAPAADVPGHAVVAVTPASGAVQHAKKIMSVTVVTFEGGEFSWRADGATPTPAFAALPLA